MGEQSGNKDLQPTTTDEEEDSVFSMNNIIRIGEFIFQESTAKVLFNHEEVRDSHPIIESNSALPKTFVPTLFPLGVIISYTTRYTRLETRTENTEK